MKLQTPAGQGHTKEAMWLIFTATLDKRKPVKPCASIQLGTICGLSHLPGVLEHTLYIHYLILATRQKLLSLLCKKIKVLVKGLLLLQLIKTPWLLYGCRIWTGSLVRGCPLPPCRLSTPCLSSPFPPQSLCARHWAQGLVHVRHRSRHRQATSPDPLRS